MNIIDKKTYEELLDRQGDLCISMYFPTFKMGPDIKQNSIRFKQRIREAEDKLYNMKLTKKEVESILKPASNLVDETKFWQNQSEALAIFIDGEQIDCYSLPYQVEEKTVLSNKFYTKPLIPLFNGEGEYYILAISQNENRFFKASNQLIYEIELKNAPESVESMKIDDDPNFKSPVKTANQLGDSSLSYNKNTQGQAPENEFDDNQIDRYFRAIDQVLDKYKKDNIPLVLAGVEYLIPIFKNISKYPNIVEEYIKGNPEILDAKDLHEKSMEFMGQKFNKIQELAKKKYEQYKGQKNKLYSNSISKIIPQAYKGQIETLFIADDLEKWGTFNPENDKVKILNDKKFEAEDLVAYAASLTTTRGGTVYSLTKDKLPDDNEIAAVLKY
jgi:release factor family 6